MITNNAKSKSKNSNKPDNLSQNKTLDRCGQTKQCMCKLPFSDNQGRLFTKKADK